MDRVASRAAVVRGAAVGLLLALGVYTAHAFSFRHYVNDDAYITFRYSRFLWQGLGPYYNAGEHVEGYTNFLLMLLMVPVLALGGEAALPTAAKVVGVIGGALSLLLAFWLVLVLKDGRGLSLESVLAGTVAAGLVSVSPAFAVNSVSGLETTLFGACVTAGVFLAALGARRDRWCGSGLAFAAAVLTRPEGPLVFAVHWVVQAASQPAATARLARVLVRPRAWRQMREDGTASRLALDAALVTGVFLVHVAFRRLAYDGEWLPNTYHAKAGGFWAIGAWQYVADGILSPLGGVLGVAAALAGLVLGRALPRRALPAVAVAVAGAALPFVVGTDWMLGQRLLMPFVPLAAVVVAIGWWGLVTWMIAKPAWAGPALGLVVVLLLWFVQSPARAAYLHDTAIRARGYHEGHEELARWLCRDATRPRDTVALMDIGIVGYRCIDRTILDITGLTDRFIAKSPGMFLDKRYDVRYILDRRPSVVIVVLWQPGDPDRPMRSVRLAPWTRVEGLLLESPEFRRWYRSASRPPAPGEPWLDALANGIGAAQVFLHAYPGRYYLLAAFRRIEAPNP